MSKTTKALGLIFLAAASVYSSQVIGAAPAKPGKPNDSKESKSTDVKLLEDPVDSTNVAAAGGAPTSQPSEGPATQPSGQMIAPAMQTNADGTFSLNITNGADLVETLRVIGFQAQKSILPSKDVHSVLPALDLYNVTVHEALEAILKVNGFVYKEQGNFIYVYSTKEAAEMEKANRVVNTEVFRLYYTPAANAMNMLKGMLSEAGQMSVTTPAATGLASGTSDVGGNTHATDDVIVVTDYTDNLDRMRKVLKEIDRRPQQILIEATILRAALSENNALGVDFNILSGVDFASLTSSNGQITGANLGTGTIAAGTNKSSVGTGNNFTQGINGGLKVGFLNDNISIFVAALEGITDTTILANPKVLALNKQKGEVIVGRKDGYLTTTLTDTTATQTVEFLDTGTRLVFRPFIGDDGYVRMEIHPEDSSGGLNNANLPFKITTEVTSNIMVKDGRTVVIGGLFRESSSTARSQIPGLGNIPLAGVLFRNQSDQTTREEIIILLTPHIVKDDAAFSDASEDLLKWGDQMRVGVRKGMMWWGRERLAETCYECAVSEMNKSHPDRNKALWHLDCATNLNPKFTEAIQMKQDITGKALTTSDNSAIRGFVRRQIMAERNAARADASEAMNSAMEPATQPSTQPSSPSSSSEFASDMGMSMNMPASMDSNSGSSSSSGVEMSPSTQPSMFSDELTLDSKAPMSSSSMSSNPTTEPSTQPSMSPQELVDMSMRSMFWGMHHMFWMSNSSGEMSQEMASSPSTQPSQKSSVTELPLDEENK